MDLWTWSPISVALFVFFIDFGAIVAIRISIERKFYLGKWLAFKLGDSIFLPLYAFFATFVIQQSRIAVSNSIQLQLFLLAIGYILVLFIEYHLVKLRIYTFKQELLPSQLYHTILFGPLFSLLLVIVPLILIYRSPIWAIIGTIITGGGYLCTSFIDFTHLTEKGMKK